MRLYSGIVSGAGAAGPSMDLSARTIAHDWTDETDPSPDWFAGGNEVYNTPIYAADGSYWDSSADPNWGGTWSYNNPSDWGVQSGTSIHHVTLSDFSGGVYIFASILGVSTSFGASIEQISFPDPELAVFVNGQTIFEQAMSLTTAGNLYLAMSYDTDGTIEVYLFDDDGLHTYSTSDTAVIPELLNQLAVQNFTTESSGFVKSLHSEHHINEILNETAITAIVTGWGWTP